MMSCFVVKHGKPRLIHMKLVDISVSMFRGRLAIVLSRKCNRGHGGICLFVRNELVEGFEILEQSSSGYIWDKI